MYSPSQRDEEFLFKDVAKHPWGTFHLCIWLKDPNRTVYILISKSGQNMIHNSLLASNHIFV